MCWCKAHCVVVRVTLCAGGSHTVCNSLCTFKGLMMYSAPHLEIVVRAGAQKVQGEAAYSCM